MSMARIPLATTLAWLGNWTRTTQLTHRSAVTVARHTGARC